MANIQIVSKLFDTVFLYCYIYFIHLLLVENEILTSA